MLISIQANSILKKMDNSNKTESNSRDESQQEFNKIIYLS